MDTNLTISQLHQRWKELDQDVDKYIAQLRISNTPGDEIDRLIFEHYGQSHHWHNAIIRPIAQAWEQAGAFEKVEVLGPFGIGAHVALHCYKNADDEAPEASLTLDANLQAGGDECVLRKVDLTSDNGQFSEGSIGRMNNLHCDHIEIANNLTIDDIDAWRPYLDTISEPA